MNKDCADAFAYVSLCCFRPGKKILKQSTSGFCLSSKTRDLAAVWFGVRLGSLRGFWVSGALVGLKYFLKGKDIKRGHKSL